MYIHTSINIFKFRFLCSITRIFFINTIYIYIFLLLFCAKILFYINSKIFFEFLFWFSCNTLRQHIHKYFRLIYMLTRLYSSIHTFLVHSYINLQIILKYISIYLFLFFLREIHPQYSLAAISINNYLHTSLSHSYTKQIGYTIINERINRVIIDFALWKPTILTMGGNNAPPFY